ncbi:MAG: metal-binding protein [Actinomycetes bacterium]|nr:MAG: metal-binding protein [Actinomycetes bacterium]
MSEPETRIYEVRGMTCGHCRAAVHEEVSAVAGVLSVEVDLPSGRLVVSGEALDDDAIVDAVEAAGYTVAAGAV